MGKIKILESEYGNIIDLYKQGYSQYELANKYNVSRDTIKEIFKNVMCLEKINLVDFQVKKLKK